MRQGTNPRRSRGRGGRKVHNPRSHMYDSNGPSVRIRGSALQIYEKYSQLSRDSQRTDRIAAENLAQHAEHYFRLANVNNALANNNGGNNVANNGARGNQGRPNGAADDGQDGDGDERYTPANEGDSQQSEEADGQHGRQQRQDQRQEQRQDHRQDHRQDQRRDRQRQQADAPQEPPAETPAAEVTVVAPPPPVAAAEPESVDSPAPAAQAENPPRRRRTARPRKTAPEAPSDGDTEPVEA